MAAACRAGGVCCTTHVTNVNANALSSTTTTTTSLRRRRRNESKSKSKSFVPAVLRSDQSPVPEGIDEVKLWVDANLSRTLGGGVVNTRSGPGGSGWAQTYVLEMKKGGKLFAKLARGRDKQMFEGEYEGLNAMEGTGAIGVPKAFHYDDLYGSTSGSWILMDFVDMYGSLDQAKLGLALGLMHSAEPLRDEAVEGSFGFHVENTIGATPQPNGWMDSWVDFYRERRLLHQLKLTQDSKLLRLGDKALERMDEVFGDLEVKPSILHGDLWSGNVAADKNGKPIIFDPACYYGHHEAEFGMSWCANFTEHFWGAYREIIPQESGFKERLQLYKLYHYLNHLNLFGGSYYYQCESILKQFN